MDYSIEETIGAAIACGRAMDRPGTNQELRTSASDRQIAIQAKPCANDETVTEVDVYARTPEGWTGVTRHGMRAGAEPTASEWRDLVTAVLHAHHGRDPDTGEPNHQAMLHGREVLLSTMRSEESADRQRYVFRIHGNGRTVTAYFRGQGSDGPDWRVGGHKQYGDAEVALRRAWAMLNDRDGDGGDDAKVTVRLDAVPQTITATIDHASRDEPTKEVM